MALFTDSIAVREMDKLVLGSGRGHLPSREAILLRAAMQGWARPSAERVPTAD